MTLAFNPEQATVMTRACAENQVRVKGQSVQKIERKQTTDGHDRLQHLPG